MHCSRYFNGRYVHLSISLGKFICFDVFVYRILRIKYFFFLFWILFIGKLDHLFTINNLMKIISTPFKISRLNDLVSDFISFNISDISQGTNELLKRNFNSFSCDEYFI